MLKGNTGRPATCTDRAPSESSSGQPNKLGSPIGSSNRRLSTVDSGRQNSTVRTVRPLPGMGPQPRLGDLPGNVHRRNHVRVAVLLVARGTEDAWGGRAGQVENLTRAERNQVHLRTRPTGWVRIETALLRLRCKWANSASTYRTCSQHTTMRSRSGRLSGDRPCRGPCDMTANYETQPIRRVSRVAYR
jgi:hypothetical protein